MLNSVVTHITPLRSHPEPTRPRQHDGLEKPLKKTEPGKKKIFVITPGRAGSTLFCSILAHCGADFGMPLTEQWDRRAGAYEHKQGYSASSHAKRALELKQNSKMSRWTMLKRKYHRRMTKLNLAAVLKKADYCKTSDADLVRWARGLGYQPSVLLLYRSFDRYCVSNYLRTGGSYARLLAHYADSVETGILAMKTFGGCVIDFDNVLDLQQTQWARSVAKLTGLESDALLSYRDGIVKPTAQMQNTIPLHDPRILAIEQAIVACGDEVFQTSAQAKRGV